jgi:hypothetical protein
MLMIFQKYLNKTKMLKLKYYRKVGTYQKKIPANLFKKLETWLPS